MVVFDSPSKPVSQAQYDICLLRRRSDLDESCIALMPVRPRDPSICNLKVTRSPLANPFPRPSQEPAGIELTHISPPPEFRRHDGNGLTAAGGIFKARELCSPGDD